MGRNPLTRLIGARPEMSSRPAAAARPASFIELVAGDITLELSDAIVNPAGGGLVDLAVRRAAGPLLVEEMHWNLLESGALRLAAGAVVATRGYGLATPNVIHCGTPVYEDGAAGAREDLIACHVGALRLARARGFSSVSFPAIGTGLYRYPVREAAQIAVRAVIGELRAQGGPREVRFVLGDETTLRCYVAAASAALGEDPMRVERGVVFPRLGR